jgi:translation initiation factor 5B
MALVDAATIVIGTPTVLVGPHPKVAYAVFLANALRPKLKYASIIGSYSWGGKAKEEILNTEVTVFNEDVIYTIIENYDVWLAKKKEELEKKRREDYIHPGMIKFLPEYVFRISHPAVIGVRVLGGRIKVDMRLIDQDGKTVGHIKGMQLENKAISEALQGAEVAISIEGVTVGRQIKGGDILFTDLPESDAKKLKLMDVLNEDEKDVLNKIIDIKRKTNKFWGM